MVAYARKQSRSAIFKWQEKEKGWYLYVGEFPSGWEKKVEVVNLLAPMKKDSMSQTAKPKSAKKGDYSSKTCFDIILYKGGVPLIGCIVLESSLPPSTCTCSSKHSTVARPRPPIPKPFVDAPPSSRTRGSKRKTSPSHLSLLRGEYVISKFCLFFILVICWAFL